MSSFTNEYQQQEELVIFARNQDILSTSERGVTTYTDTLTSTGSDVFTLTRTKGIRNIRYITNAGTTKSAYTHFTPTYNTGVITMSGVSTGDDVVIQYDQGPRDTIYGELPREIIDRMALPRIMVKILAPDTKEFSLGGSSNITDNLITFQMWGTTIKRVYNMVSSVRAAVLNNKKNFYHFPFITVLGRGQTREDYQQQGDIFTKNVDCMARWTVERV